jgi:hypothetical protein
MYVDFEQHSPPVDSRSGSIAGGSGPRTRRSLTIRRTLSVLMSALIASVIAATPAAAAWSAPQPIPYASSSNGSGLGVTVYGGALHMVYKGSGTDQRLFWTTYNGASWSYPQQIPGANSTNGGYLQVFNGRLNVVYKGSGTDERLWSASYDGSAWTSPQPIPYANSTNGAYLAAFGGRLQMVYKGSGTDQRLFYSAEGVGCHRFDTTLVPCYGAGAGVLLGRNSNELAAGAPGARDDGRCVSTTRLRVPGRASAGAPVVVTLASCVGITARPQRGGSNEVGIRALSPRVGLHHRSSAPLMHGVTLVVQT